MTTDPLPRKRFTLRPKATAVIVRETSNRRIMPYHESSDFDATRTFYTRVLGLEEGSFGGDHIGFGSGPAQVVFGPVDEPWGVRRFFVRDPNGVVLSVLAHE